MMESSTLQGTIHTADTLSLLGIDGTTPLGFLAAVGVLQVLTERATSEGSQVKLRWQRLDAWRPELQGSFSISQVMDLVVDDVRAWASSSILAFRYVKVEKQGPKPVGGLRAPLAVVRAWQRARREDSDEGALAFGAALFCDQVLEPIKSAASAEDHAMARIAVDGDVPLDSAVERTFLDFTSRNAQFLEQVECIREYLTAERVQNELEDGRLDPGAPRTLDWDPAADTPGAIYTGFRRDYLPAQEWLAFRALALFPTTAVGGDVRMTGCTGRRLRGEFTWPLWRKFATLDAIRSLVGYPRLDRLGVDQRRALGIAALFSAELTKKADGYTGTFSPTRPV